ncbi:aminoglycoside phosphotransferase family protein [Persicimonas caeni]|uniref:Aminoglycoside phosphotransferase family protein n=1 Tax=Persicimonas caeni TaxID=2292766 RepID=A0A4Y6Q069_PERCE|nr:phosphotransferase [Persicimonas caeni]QDG53954.1 aminoglycoside phosphotransferase family protein [Persicimonas caeni]QED35175.1 aminoglycoside phosphotransferase family protein [Persicimonas caeni]
MRDKKAASAEKQWLEYFRARGYPDATRLAAGMEGAVYSLVPGELVAKVWFHRGADTLRPLAAYYDRLSRANHSLRTPKIHRIDTVDGVAITTEDFLPGTPLDQHLVSTAKRPKPQAVDALVEVLSTFLSIGEASEFRQVFVLDETESFWEGSDRWSDSIGGLLRRRVARFATQLEREVSKLDALLEATHSFLESRDNATMSVIHGDLCPANILVNDDIEPVSVLDFGFLSTVGDPAFDASITSAIFEMWGPCARELDEQLTTTMQRAFGYDRDTLLAYRAVYALLTSNAYAPDGTDGHFRWCVEMLDRQDVRDALGM